MRYTLPLLALGITTAAEARPGFMSASPQSMSFTYDWYTVPDTAPLPRAIFTFAPGTASPSGTTLACDLLADGGFGQGCFSGTFTTNNGGQGTYVTTTRGPSSFLELLACAFANACVVRQNIQLDYTVFTGVTNARYTGSAYFGLATVSFSPLEVTAFAADARRFTGTMSGPSTGGFCENSSASTQCDPP